MLYTFCSLNISTADEATPSRTYRRTPVRSTTKKRKRGEADFGSFLQQRASAGYTQKSSAKGAIEVYETDTEGKYIKLFNNGERVSNMQSYLFYENGRYTWQLEA